MCKYFKTILFFFNKCYRIFGFFLISLLEYFLTFLKVNKYVQGTRKYLLMKGRQYLQGTRKYLLNRYEDRTGRGVKGRKNGRKGKKGGRGGKMH